MKIIIDIIVVFITFRFPRFDASCTLLNTLDGVD